MQDQSGQVSAGGESVSKKVSTSQASRSREKPIQIAIQNNSTSKNTQRANIIKSDLVSSGSAAPQTGSNLGSSIPTNTKRSQAAAAHGQKKATVRRRENGNHPDAVANMKLRHKSAALNKTDLGPAGQAKSISLNLKKQTSAGSRGSDNNSSQAVRIAEPDNLSISNLRHQSAASQKSHKVKSVKSKKSKKNASMRQLSVNSSKSKKSVKSQQPSVLSCAQKNGSAKLDEDAAKSTGAQIQQTAEEEKKETIIGQDGREEAQKSTQSEQHTYITGQNVTEQAVNIKNIEIRQLEDGETPVQRRPHQITMEELDRSAGLKRVVGARLSGMEQAKQENEDDSDHTMQLQKSPLQREQLPPQEQSSVNSPTMIRQEDSEIQSPLIPISTIDQQFESARSESGAEKILEFLPAPNPLLPKTLKVQEKPPESNIKGIVFRKLKEFKSFPEQPNDQLTDYVRQIKHDRTKTEVQSPLKDKVAGPGSVQMSIEQSRLIRNIVFLRDVTILDNLGKGIDELTQKDVFQHENFLDVKQLIRERDICSRMTDQLENAIQRAKRQQQTKNNSNISNEQTPGGTLDIRTGCYRMTGPEDKTLQFESRFESGNLYLATKVSEQEYDLLMQNDTNTLGHTQWFYFKVSNTRAGVPVKFNILNYNKPDSMFNYGMKVSVYSDQKAEAGIAGWHRTCTDISYFKNQVRKDFNFAKYYHTLTFTYEFQYDNDSVFFAYCYPYTFTDLSNDIMSIERDKRRQSFMTRHTLCKTLGGVNCEVLTITEQKQVEKQPVTNVFGAAAANDKKQAGQTQKRGIVISSRVHPGETVGSWMMRGVIFFLTDPDNKEAMVLRKNFIFKIVPMLNPDGVINGNYRCSLAGCDLNRRWKFPSKQLQPTVYHTKRLIKKVHTERTCVLYCDLHGHSRKPNVFMYGCDKKGAPEETRIFPLLLSKISPLFDFSASRFGVQKSKEATARVAVFKELKTCPLVYTMESTFSGLDKGPFSGLHITTDMLESMGRDLCRALLIQCNLEVPKELQSMPTKGKKPSKTFSAEPPSDGEVMNQHALSIKQTLIAELTANKELLRAGMGDSSSGSDSEPSEDNLEATELVKNLPAVDKPLSLALKVEQAARKEQAKQRRQERANSPVKGGEPRWRFTTTSTMKNYLGDNLEPTSGARSRKRQAIKLSEIKEDRHEEMSNNSPLKVVRDITKQPVKNPKVKMVDAITQTDRSDYMLLKARNQNKMMKNSGQREGTVQLRIANIELHETAFTAGSRSGFQNQTHHQHTTHETTVNIQGPTVSDFNAIFSTGQVQVQATIKHQNQNSGGTVEGSHRQKQSTKLHSNQPQTQQDLQYANAHYQKHRPPMMNKTLNMNPVNKPFIQYVNRQQREKAPTTPGKNKSAGSRKGSTGQHTTRNTEQAGRHTVNEEMIANDSSKDMTPSQRTERSQNQVQARYGSVQQPRLKQLQEFQALSRAAQQHITQSKSQQNGNGQPDSATISQQQVMNQEILDTSGIGIANNLAKEADLVSKDLMNRMVSTGGNPQRFLANTSDYPTHNFKKAKRFQIGSGGGPGIHNNAQMQLNRQNPSGRKSSQHTTGGSITMQQNEVVDVQLAGQNVGEMIVIEAQQKQRAFGPQNLRMSNDPFQQKSQPHQRGGRVQEKQQRSQQKSNQSPLIAFLENQIQFERNQFEKSHLVNHKSVQRSVNENPIYHDSRAGAHSTKPGANPSSFSRTAGFNSNQHMSEEQQRTTLYLQERTSETKSNNQHQRQLRPIVTNNGDPKDGGNYAAHHFHGPSQSTSPVKLAQAQLNLQRWQTQLSSQTTKGPGGHHQAAVGGSTYHEPYSDASFVSSMVDFQKGGHTGANTSKQMGKPTRKLVQVGNNKAIPAGVRNQVQQQNISNLYNKVYSQQQTSHGPNHNRVPSDGGGKASHDPNNSSLMTSMENTNQSQLFAKNTAQSVKGAGYTNNSVSKQQQSVQYVDHSNSNMQNGSAAKFMMQTKQSKTSQKKQPAGGGGGGSGGANNLFQMHGNESPPNNTGERLSIQQMKERQNISDMQIYRNKTMQSALSNNHGGEVAGQLPTLQKFGSQNEILNSRSNLRAAAFNSHSKNPSGTNASSFATKNQHHGAPQNWVRSQPTSQGQYHNQVAGGGEFEYPVPFVGKEQKTIAVPPALYNSTPVSAHGPQHHNSNQVAELSKAHADGRPLNNNSTTAAQNKLDSDYFMIMRQHNQAFVPMGTTITKKKVSSSSHNSGTMASMALSAAQAHRTANKTIMSTNSGNQQTNSTVCPQISRQQSPPGTTYHRKSNKLDGPGGEMSTIGNYMAGATGPVDFGVLQTRQLVNANNNATSQFKQPMQQQTASTGLGNNIFAPRKTSGQNNSNAGAGGGALPTVQAGANAAAASSGGAPNIFRPEVRRKTSNPSVAHASYISSKK